MCNNGTYVPHRGGSSAKDCVVCPRGTNQSKHAGFRACFCKNSYARTDRYGPCTLCEDEGLDCLQEFKSLLPGYYWNWNFQKANVSNYKKFITNLRVGGMLINSHTSYTGNFPRIYKCPREKSCPNSNGDIEGQCSDGYTGWLCSSCLPGYYAILNSCVRCPRKEVLIIECGIFLSIFVAICLLFARHINEHTKSRKKTRTVLDVVISRLKILLGFYQVVGEIFSSLHEINWTGPLVIIGTFISSLELNILKIFVRPRCFSEDLVVNPKTEFIIGVSCPVLIILTLLVVYQLKKIYLSYKYYLCCTKNSRSSNCDSLRIQLCTCGLVLQFLFYPPICSIIFQMYPGACRTFYFDKTENYPTTRLRSDYDIVCENMSIYHTCAYVFTVIYVIAFPIILLYLLWTNIPCRPSRLNRSERRCCSLQGGEFINNYQDISLTRNSGDEDFCLVPLWLNFLCENYKREYWFWEIIELCRKVTQTFLITLYGWEDQLTVLLTTCISVLFLLLHAWHRPMQEPYEQRLQVTMYRVYRDHVIIYRNNGNKFYAHCVKLPSM
ncbi:hypothetical protein HOLleu_20408 [Holothuria leucospilota]|uniref:DUF7630 domain-containing protein n=1 Tax=Holothuria leucospilota TaxID=206669 RepID=A0A9Q1C0R3_HOLLE|nr:hypothetical protein HOLleu_20408 [Holothuria leucospilota]